MKKIFKKLADIFKTKTGGYHVRKIVYHYNGEPSIGYILCQDYWVFGIYGYNRISVHLNNESAQKELAFYQSLDGVKVSKNH